MKLTDKFEAFEQPHKYNGLIEQNPNDLIVHYVHFFRSINPICVACYDCKDNVLYRTIDWRPPEGHPSLDTMLGTAPYFYANDKYVDRQVIESLLNEFPKDYKQVHFLGMMIDGSSSSLSIPRLNIEYDWCVRDETYVLDMWTEKLLEIGL